MANRRLNDEELIRTKTVLEEIKGLIKGAAGDDEGLRWAMRRHIVNRLMFEERGRPMDRRIIKLKMRAAQRGLCAVCKRDVPERGAALDRFEAMKGYVEGNVRLLCTAARGT